MRTAAASRSLRPTQPATSLTPEGVLSVGQQFEGTASDAEGDAAWGVSAQLVADLGSNGSSGSLRFVLERDGVQTAYLGTLDGRRDRRLPRDR